MTDPKRARLIYIIKILMKHTDKDHVLTSSDICALLDNEGISAERKAVYKDIEAIRECGFPVILKHSGQTGYYAEPYPFSPDEINLIEDAVFASEFIPKKKSYDIAKKLDALSRECLGGSPYSKRVYIPLRAKSGSHICEKYAVACAAMDEHKKLRIIYENGHGGTVEYIVTPYRIARTDEGLVLAVGGSELDGAVRLFRFGLIISAEITSEPAEDVRAVTGDVDFNVERYIDGVTETETTF